MKTRNVLLLALLTMLGVIVATYIYLDNEEDVRKSNWSEQNYSNIRSRLLNNSSTAEEVASSGNEVNNTRKITRPDKSNSTEETTVKYIYTVNRPVQFYPAPVFYTASTFETSRNYRNNTYVYDNFDYICNEGGHLTVTRDGIKAPMGLTLRLMNGSAVSGTGLVINSQGKGYFTLQNGDCIDKYGYISIEDATLH